MESYGATIGVSDLFAFIDAREVLGEFGATRSTQIQGLRRFVESDRTGTPVLDSTVFQGHVLVPGTGTWL